MWKRLILYAAVCLCALGAIVYAVRPKTKTQAATADQALAHVRQFCAEVGWKPEGKPVVEKNTIGWPAGVWSVEYRDKADNMAYSFSAGGPEGQVLSAIQWSEWERLVKPVPAKITREQANKAAEKFLRVIGADMSECRMDYSKLDKPSDKDTPTTWEVRYSRFHKGYEFESDGAYVDLDPADGSLVSLHYDCTSELPKTTSVSIKKEEAIRIATNFLEPKGSVDRVKCAELWIAQPTFAEDFELDQPDPTKSYLCWYVYVYWDKGHEAYVYVDASNGKVRGWNCCM